MGEQYQAKTQLTGIVAGLSMIVLLLGGTGFIGYLPGAGADGNRDLCSAWRDGV